MLYYLDKDGASQGPVTQGTLLDLWRRGVVTDETPTSLEGDQEWLPLTMNHDVIYPPKRANAPAPVAK